MIKKALITEEEEIQLLSNVLTGDCSISQRMLDIHYKQQLNDYFASGKTITFIIIKYKYYF